MIKKTITFDDFNGDSRTESFYFNLTKAEIMEMEMGTQGGLTEMIQRIIETRNMPEIMKVFKELIIKSHGEKSADGRQFVKNKEITDAFVQTEAYSEIFMELATDSDKASEFVNGIIPKNLEKDLDKAQKGNLKPVE